MSGEKALRLRLVEAARKLSALGLNPGRSGNLSARAGSGFVITPSGVAYDALPVDALVFLETGGAEGEAHRRASSEWRLHRDIYRSRPETGAVVHTHSPFATTLACLGRGIPPFHYEVAFAGGRDIRCAPYTTYGTQQLSDLTAAALEGRRACLLANHGAVATGATIEDALGLAEKVEALAQLYWQVIQAGEPVLLDAVEMDRVIEKFRTYGKPVPPT